MSEAVATGDRPTMAQAFSAPDSPTGTAPTTESTAAPTTEAPASGTTTSPATDGPIPLDRHKSILDGAYKERDGYKQQLDQLSWARDVDREAVERANQIGQLYQRDRAGYIRAVLDEALLDADLAPVLRSEFGRRLGTRTADATIEPDIPVYDNNGQLVSRTYSHEALAKIRAQDREALKRELLGEITPIKETFEKQQAREKAYEQRQQALQKVDAVVSRLEKLPLYKEYVADIAKAMDLPEFADLDPIEQAYAAYHHVTQPKLQQTHQAQTLATLEKQAAAAQVNPNAAVVTSKARPVSLLDKSLQW